MEERSVPILPSRDIAESLAFYRGLGFEIRKGPPEEWNYLITGRGSVEIHFFWHPTVDPSTTAASCYVYVKDAQALYDEWAAIFVPDSATGSRLVEPQDTEYGIREFAVVDRSGNLIRIGSPISA